MRILVTGGAGFLGSHLCDKLLNLGHEVVSIDNFHTGRIKNIEHLRSNPYFESIRHDVTIPISMELDGIFNLACPASPQQYQNDPVKTLKTNVLGAINMLDLALKCDARILQASTSEIYGDPEVHPQPESYWGKVNSIGIRACYDEGKRAAETLFFDFNRQHGLDIRVARIFNTFGPRMALLDGRVVTNFISQALSNEPITIYGDGSQTRSFCFVDDLIEGLISLFFSSPPTMPFNLGNPTPVSMNELAQQVIGLTDSKSEITYCDLPLDDPRDREPDISNAILHLNWKPAVSREEGLRITIEDIKHQMLSTY